jgi:catechol 2,3-dioxygenase-like lactoylglutathione lyase family enzyme
MITSIHTMIYSDDAGQTRAFLRDVLGWANVDAHGGWLIFNSGPSEMGVHPTHNEWQGQTIIHEKHHEISLMCDDLEATVADLRAKGAQFEGEIETQSYGRLITMVVPGAGNWQLYQPSHPTAYNL